MRFVAICLKVFPLFLAAAIAVHFLSWFPWFKLNDYVSLAIFIVPLVLWGQLAQIERRAEDVAGEVAYERALRVSEQPAPRWLWATTGAGALMLVAYLAVPGNDFTFSDPRVPAAVNVILIPLAYRTAMSMSGLYGRTIDTETNKSLERGRDR